MATIAKAYYVDYKRVPGEGGKAYEGSRRHGLLLARAGRLTGTIDYGEAPETALAKLTALAGPEHDAGKRS